MRCPRCGRDNPEQTVQCGCGFRFDNVGDHELKDWFGEIQDKLETAYFAAKTPWQQSGKSGSFEDWTRLRIPIAECIDRNGIFLDIGCANGFLLECLLDWTAKKGIKIIPYGLDFAPQLVQLAKERLRPYADNIFLGNAWDWQPPRRFDYVRAEIVYVPVNLRKRFIRRLLADFLSPGGKLILAQYRSRHEDLSAGWIDAYLLENGFIPEAYHTGFDGEGRKLTRVAVLRA